MTNTYHGTWAPRLVWYTHSIDVSEGVVKYINIRSKADGYMKGDSGITGVLTAMENVG